MTSPFSDILPQGSLFDTELVLNEIKGEARQIIKSQTTWETDRDLKILNKVLHIDYNRL